MKQSHSGDNRLPAPEPEAAAHSLRLVESIRAEILANGNSIPFHRFMELALYAPGQGYYSAGSQKFGPAGDFTTAPELSPLFSRCLARQCLELLVETGGSILELGAGSGIMAADILLELKALGCLPERYAILELSGELRERQRQVIAARAPELVSRVAWLETLPKPGFRGVIVGNEILDALPVQRFRIAERGPVPLAIAWEDRSFAWREAAGDDNLTSFVQDLQVELGLTLPIGYESERNPALPAWLKTFAEILETGALLLIDYGYPRREYYHPQRAMGTLLCHYRHHVHDDPLILVGLQDITASVDFTAVAEAALAADLTIAGYTSQCHFLLACGLPELWEEHDQVGQGKYLDLARQVKLLTLPGQMGDRFKAIALTREIDFPLRGFALLDERGRL